MRMIERWFPCTEVSEASNTGWGSGKRERRLFSWFAARPAAQAKAAVLTSLFPWPDDNVEQNRLQDLVRRSMSGQDAAYEEIVAELRRLYPNGATILDPFSGRALIPLEAARFKQKAIGLDYSPVADLAGHLLANFPMRDWSNEPAVDFAHGLPLVQDRLLADVEQLFGEIGRRSNDAMNDYYPPDPVNGVASWAYLWAVTLPCQSCFRRFPLVSSLELRRPTRKGDPGQSFRLTIDRGRATFTAEIHDGPPQSEPTLRNRIKDGRNVPGKVAICPFCDFTHARSVHARLAGERLGEDILLAVAELSSTVGKSFREPNAADFAAIRRAEDALQGEAPFESNLTAIPSELVPPGNNTTVTPSLFGAKSYGDFCNARQTLGLIRLCRTISSIGTELQERFGTSPGYAAALVGYAGAVLVRKLRYSTRGAWLRKSAGGSVAGIFVNEASINFSYDYLEVGLGRGPATWTSLAEDTLAALRGQFGRPCGVPATLSRGSALALPLRDNAVDAVVTDPPYDAMIPYTDVSDLYFVWLRRALHNSWPDFLFTSDPHGVQEKAEEIIVKRQRPIVGDHRTQAHYDRLIAKAFAEARRVVQNDGVVTIVFGHGDPEVWHRLLKAISSAGLVLTGSWPAKTESGGTSGSANIVTTLTMACRPAPLHRPDGRGATVEAEVRRVVRERVPAWDAAGLAPTDQLMASAGPAMEVAGQYKEILDHLGDKIDPTKFLIIARRAVREAAAIQIDTLPLESFDSRTGFALYWVRLYARSIAAKSEARWEALAADLSSDGLRAILVDVEKGVRFGYASELSVPLTETSSTIDVALAMAKAWKDGLDAVGQVLLVAGRDGDDAQLWAALAFLSTRLPEADPDAIAWTALVRNRRGIKTVARDMGVSKERDRRSSADKARQGSLFDLPTTASKGGV